MQAFLHGMVLAMGLILPLGVQNLFVFTQGVTQASFLRVLPAVITASICDTVLILLAVEGVSVFVASFVLFKILLLTFGIIFLCYMGWITWNSIPVGTTNDETKSVTMKQQILFAVSVSLFNPHAVLDTIGVIGTSSIHYVEKEKFFFTLACILVSWCWFLFLAVLGRGFGKRKGFRQMFGLINKVSAVFMWLSALYMIFSSTI